MNRRKFIEGLRVGDLVYLDPSKVRTTWAKRWANNGWAVEVRRIHGSGINDDTALSGVCSQDKDEGEKKFDANRILSFADNLSQIKRDSQRL
mgnify:CR=1 FL=1